MQDSEKLLIFRLDNTSFAIHLNDVERIIRIVEISALPESAKYIMGVIDYHGEFIPVVDTRYIFKLPQRDFEIQDKLIVTNLSGKRIAFWVDSTDEIDEFSGIKKQVVDDRRLIWNI